jgi:serine/threonine-protein kinase
MIMQSIYSGIILGKRYRVIQAIGQGGFGKTYLAEDQHRFQELCILKQFAPQIQGQAAWQKSQELFARESNILHRLQHPQIPKFKECFQENINNQLLLFLVQEYVDGYSYRQLLTDRQKQGQVFSEMEVRQLLLQILPVLDYLHNIGVIHRDISPDNIIRRNSDGLPILIDFGGVKELAGSNQYAQVNNGQYQAPTILGKAGYAPDEQMRLGIVYPQSDLYALAVTALVLLTGQEPNILMDPHNLTFTWRKYAQVSQPFGQALDQMLASRPGDRFATARQVLQVLGNISNNPFDPHNNSFNQPMTATTHVVAPAYHQPKQGQNQPANQPTNQLANIPSANLPAPPRLIPVNPSSKGNSGFFSLLVKRTLILGIFMLIMGTFGWKFGKYWVYHFSENTRYEKLKDKPLLDERIANLAIEKDFFYKLTDQTFYQRYPQYKGRVIDPTAPGDELLRKRWHLIADELIKRLEKLNVSQRQNLSRYDDSFRQERLRILQQLNISSKTLQDLADGRFFHLFPEYKRQQKLNSSSGDTEVSQVWQAIAEEVLDNLNNGKSHEEIEFPPGSDQVTLNGQLIPGEGKVFTGWFKSGQILTISLITNEDKSLFSIYGPGRKTRRLPNNSQDKNWKVSLRDTGNYQLVLVSTGRSGDKPLSYQLEIRTR